MKKMARAAFALSGLSAQLPADTDLLGSPPQLRSPNVIIKSKASSCAQSNEDAQQDLALSENTPVNDAASLSMSDHVSDVTTRLVAEPRSAPRRVLERPPLPSEFSDEEHAFWSRASWQYGGY
jgi:hypothetical protein